MYKRGDFKYDILMYLILGVLVLGISLFFIFQEFWTGDDSSREICAQSIQLRALTPEVKKAGLAITDFKDQFPLKCKTNVVDISLGDIQDIKRAQGKIAESMAECWALYGSGDYDVFPSEFYGPDSICTPCSRIHLTKEARDYMVSNNVRLSIKDSLNLKMREGYTYYSYLDNSGDQFPAFSLASSLDFVLDGDAFEVREEGDNAVIFINRLTGAKDEGYVIFGDSSNKISRIILPEFMNPQDGDLIINYGTLTFTRDMNVGEYVPFLFYFQTGQIPNPFEEVRKELYNGLGWEDANVCDMWEGIPG